jgi:hypothetical protein
MKSSADSISILPLLDGRLTVAILPSGSPVLKKNGAPKVGPAVNAPASNMAGIATIDIRLIISAPFARRDIKNVQSANR